MAKKMAALMLALLMLGASAFAETTVEKQEGEKFFPSEENWTYHFTYSYPHLTGEDGASAMINDTYEMVLDEMLHLVLPMFANEKDMLFDGKNEVHHDFIVTCNSSRFLSIVQRRSQTMGDEGTMFTLDSLVFDMAGDYIGQSLTLRGVVMVGESTDQIAAGVTPVLMEEFVKLQKEGIIRSDLTRDELELEFSAARDFYADEEGNAVFFVPPMLLKEPSFDVPTFTFTPAQLEALLPPVEEEAGA